MDEKQPLNSEPSKDYGVWRPHGMALFALLFVVMAQFSLILETGQEGVTPVWLPSGLVFSVFFLFGFRMWPGVFAGMLVVAYMEGIPYEVATIAAIGAILESLIPIRIMRNLGFPSQIYTLGDLFLFLGAAVIAGPLIGAGIGTLSMYLYSGGTQVPTLNLFMFWWLGNAFGIMILGSITLVWKDLREILARKAIALQTLALMALIGLISYMAFEDPASVESVLELKLTIPIFVLIAIRFGLAGVTLSALVATIMMVLTVSGVPADTLRQSELGLFYLDILQLAITIVTSMIVAAAYQDREQYQEVLWMASHDALTELSNRAELLKRLTEKLNGIRKSDGVISVMFIDLDNLKEVNDQSGHAAGDALLRKAAQSLQNTTRDTDTVARFGGDEFVVVLPECGQEQAREIGVKLLEVMNHNELEWDEIRYPVEASIGIASTHNGEESCNTLLERADAACYEAKNKGRNQIKVSATASVQEAVRE